MVGLLSVSILYEGLRQLRDFFLNRFADTRKSCLNGTLRSSGSVTRRNRPGRAGNKEESAGGSTRRCDSIRYYNINARNPQQFVGAGDNNETLDDDNITESSKWIHRSGAGDQTTTSSSSSPAIIHSGNVRLRIEDLFFATVLHMVYITLGYCLMLAVMTFNTYIFISVCAGVGIGYLVFGTFRRFDHLATYKKITIRECCDPGNASVGPLIPGSSTSSTNSDKSDTAFTVKEQQQRPGQSSSKACCIGEDDDNDPEEENKSLVVGAQVH